jgi:intein/homing endonuclease
MVSTRADIITRRTYSRPIVDGGDSFETWDDTCQRVIGHQCWLWERALTHKEYPEIPLHDLSDDMQEWVSLNESQQSELHELYNLIHDRKLLPAGRTLWLGGTTVAQKREASMFNCAHTNIETVYDVVDAFWLLLQGCGVGFTPIVGTLTGFRKPIPKITINKSTRVSKGRETNEETFEDGVWTISIGDSAEAWAKSIGKLLAGKYEARELVFDFTEIRPAGQRLKGYGWISSGDSSISVAFPAIGEILSKRAGALLTKIDILDIVNWLGTVLSSRRSAEIALCEYGSAEWYEFATAKERCYEEGFKHRQQSNNSLVFYKKPTREELENLFDMIVKSGGSEPGLVNGEAALKRAPWFKGLNPSLRAGTRVYTNDGIVPIEELENKDFQVFTDEKILQRATCRLSGKDKQLYKLTLEGGHEIYATKEHNWPIYRKGYNTHRDKWGNQFKATTDELQAGDCLPNYRRKELYTKGSKGSYNDGLFLGWLQGDGWVTIRKDNNQAQIGMVVSKKETEMIPILQSIIEPYSEAKLIERDNGTYELNTQNKSLYTYLKSLGYCGKNKLPKTLFSSEYSENFRKGFIDGIFSSDGHIENTKTATGFRVNLTSSRMEFLKEISELLGFYGIKTSVTSTETTLAGYDKIYTQGKLRIGSYLDIKHFKDLFKLSVAHKQKRLDSIKKPKRLMLVDKIQIKSIEKTELYEDVWDIGVYGNTHTFQIAHCITGNCAEILLANKSFCNLVEVDVAKFYLDSSGLHRALTLAARMNYRQTVVDFRDGVLQEAWHLNNEFLRLCGAGVTGIVQRDDLDEFEWKSLKYSAVTAARTMAKELNLQHPKNVTTVKPSGTVSKIMDTTEGVHKPLGRYIFNWVNFSKSDPIVDIVKASNYKVLDNPSDSTGCIVCLPVDWSHIEFDIIEQDDGSSYEVNLETAVSQLDRYLKIQNNYCDHNVSNTISYDKNEVPSIIDWLMNNWDSYVAVSFLFRTDPTMKPRDLGFDYLPQEVVTKEVYDRYVSHLLPVDFDAVHTYDELDEDECLTGACPIK